MIEKAKKKGNSKRLLESLSSIPPDIVKKYSDQIAEIQMMEQEFKNNGNPAVLTLDE